MNLMKSNLGTIAVWIGLGAVCIYVIPLSVPDWLAVGAYMTLCACYATWQHVDNKSESEREDNLALQMHETEVRVRAETEQRQTLTPSTRPVSGEDQWKPPSAGS